MKKFHSIAFLLIFATISFSPFPIAANERLVSQNFLSPFGNEIEYGFDQDERIIFDLINRERSKRKLSNLYWRGDLTKLARSYAEKWRVKTFSVITIKTARTSRTGRQTQKLKIGFQSARIYFISKARTILIILPCRNGCSRRGIGKIF